MKNSTEINDGRRTRNVKQKSERDVKEERENEIFFPFPVQH